MTVVHGRGFGTTSGTEILRAIGLAHPLSMRINIPKGVSFARAFKRDLSVFGALLLSAGQLAHFGARPM